VIFDGGSATAEVLSIDGESVEISAGSMRMRVALSRLSKVSGPAEQQVHVRHPTLTPDAGQGYRIDVRGERVEPAIQRVMRFVDTAVAGGLHHVEILHGTGTGALRKAIQEYLQSRPDVSGVSDAPVDAGGAGVTVVDLSL
jgi:DNA mismatch repair protein MutS2